MSSAGSLGEADAKFPGQENQNAIPPSPTRENPGAVYPKSSPEAEKKGDEAKTDTVAEIQAGDQQPDPFRDNFEHAKAKASSDLTTQEGPMFTD